jgi:tetratricopeptide (TPR) repeat protein
VADPAAIRYRAFLSYSPRDISWSKWLHRALDRFRIDKDLVGRATSAGLVPRTLRPIFRDREDFSGGPKLPRATVAALHASAALLVLCSTASAKRPAVNEQIRLFRSRHPDRPVIPIIVDNKAPQNLPRALRYQISPDGAITDHEVAVLGPDLRDSGDGKSLGLAKVIAGLTGVGTDEILRSAERAHRRRHRFWAAVTGLFLLFGAAAGGSAAVAWQQLKTNEAFLDGTLVRATKIVSGLVVQAKKHNVSRTMTLMLLGNAEGLFNTVAENGAPTPQLGYRKAWMLIQFARDYQVLDEPDKQYARLADAHRLLAALGAERPHDTAYRLEASVAYDEIGEALLAQGKLAEAMSAYRDALAIKEQLVNADLANATWQHDLSVAYQKMGDLQVAQGKVGEALKSYRDGLAVREQLAKSDPTNAAWQSDLSVSFDRIGDLLAAQHNLAEALKSYRSGLAARAQLVNADPTNTRWQRDLAASNDKVGDVLVAQGNFREALKSYDDGLAIREKLTSVDPTNAAWQRDLSVSYDKVGDLLMAEGNLREALKSYRAGFAISERLTKADPTNSGWQRDLSVSYDKLGDLLVADGNLHEALKTYRDGLAVRERLAKADPGNAGRQRDLWMSYNKIGSMLVAQGNSSEALKSFREGVAVGERLAKVAAIDADWQRDLLVTYNKIGDMLVAQGNPDEALKCFRDGVAVGERLANADPSNWGWQRDLSVSYNKIGEIMVAQGKLDEALNAYRGALVITQRLAAADRSDIERQRGLQFSIRRIGSLTYGLVLAHDFGKALEAADEVISASPGTILLHLYRARALMFLGRVEEARTLYLRYRREPNVQNGKSWETLALEDFAELRKAGLAHPLMDEIEKRFRAGR